MGAPPASPCGTCDARCCSAYAVNVTGDDAWRLAEGTGLPLDELLTYRREERPSPAGFLLEPRGPTHELLLAHARPAGHRPPCAFLRAGDGGAPRCGVYAFRPRACRRFPAVRLGPGFGVRDGIPCPPGAWAGHDMARLSWRVAVAREEREAEAYAAVVAAWNARVAAGGAAAPGALLAYLDWLADAYRWLVPWRAALAPSRRAGAAFAARVRETLGACAGG
jgi:Fe-S-cluster containining protein